MNDYTTESVKSMAAARARGEVVIERDPWDLLLDLDGGILGLSTKLKRLWIRRVQSWEWWESKTPDHFHAVIHLKRDSYGEPSPLEVVALQLFLGSDPKREQAALHDVRVGNPHYSILFQPTGADVRKEGGR